MDSLSNPPTKNTKGDKFRIIIIIIAFGVILSTWQYAKNYLLTQNVNNHKMKVVSSDDSTNGVIEFRNEFDYTPDFNDFFEVLDSTDVDPSKEMSAGEKKVREQLAEAMLAAQPKLIQMKASPIECKKLLSESNPNKGKVFWVAGKVIDISIAPKNPNIMTAQFLFQYQIEMEDGNVVQVQSIRATPNLRLGDVVFVNGVYLKLVFGKEKTQNIPLILSNYVQNLLPLPAMWETAEGYQAKRGRLYQEAEKLFGLPKELNLEKWSIAYNKLIEEDDQSWVNIADKTDEESQKLSADVEKRLIADLAIVPEATLLDQAKLASNINWNEVKPEQFRRTVVSFSGKLDSIAEVPLLEPIQKVVAVYYAKVIDLKGNSFYFNFVYPIFSDQEDRELWKEKDLLLPKEGDLVFCAGVYVQSVKSKKEITPVFYGKQLSVIGNYYNIFNSIDHGGKRIADNNYGDLMDAGKLEKMPYSYLLAKVSYLNSKTILDAFMNIKQEERISFEGMMKDPAEAMDKPYVRYGKVILITKYEGIPYYDFHGVRELYEIYFYDINKRLHVLVTPTIPEGLAVSERATFTGYFFKRYAYRNRDGNATWVPFLVGYVHDIEVEKPKVMSVFEKVILALFVLLILGIVVRLNKKAFSKKKESSIKQANIEFVKTTRELLKTLTEKNVQLDEHLVTYFHYALIEDMPIPLELCNNITYWPEHADSMLLRPEYIKSEYEVMIKHYQEFKTEIPRDMKIAFFNKRKELVGLRSFQISKFEISDEEKKRTDNILITPLSYILNQKENFNHLNGFLDQYGLPPYNTWIKIGRIPRYVIRNSTAAYTPESLVIVSYLPPWIAEQAKANFKVVAKEMQNQNHESINEEEKE